MVVKESVPTWHITHEGPLSLVWQMIGWEHLCVEFPGEGTGWAESHQVAAGRRRSSEGASRCPNRARVG